MEIAEARVIVARPGRDFVTLMIVTDSGVTGVGAATLNGRELAAGHPYRPANLPVNRLADGAMHSW